MKKLESLKISGWVEIRKNGILVSSKSNLIVDVGKDGMARALNDIAQPFGANTHFTHIQIGTGATAPVAGNIALETAITADPPIAVIGGLFGEGIANRAFVAPKQATWDLTFTATAGVTVTETGLFNDQRSTTPVMLARQTFSIALVATDTLKITWTITIQ